jgi:hypothetical protein
MKKFIAFLLFFASFGIVMAQGSPLKGLWPSFFNPPSSGISAPATEVRSTIPLNKCNPESDEAKYCANLSACSIGWNERKCWGKTGNPSNPCRPIGCSPSDIKSPPLTVAVRISTKQCLANGKFKISLKATPSGGTPPYSYVWVPSGASGSTASFTLNVGATLNAIVTIRDASGKTVVGMLSVDNACPPSKPAPACKQLEYKYECLASNLSCEWVPPQQYGDAISRGYCKDKELVCNYGKINCDSDNECVGLDQSMPVCGAMYPNQGASYTQCMTSKKCQVYQRCLSSSSRIATPIGDVRVTDLKVGDIVWTVDATGNRIVRSLVKVSRVSAPNHRVVHLVLTDGRTLDVSALHGTADGRTVGDLEAGDAYDNSTVKTAELKPYEGTATYDILPAGPTGYYFANDILMGSTLK